MYINMEIFNAYKMVSLPDRRGEGYETEMFTHPSVCRLILINVGQALEKPAS